LLIQTISNRLVKTTSFIPSLSPSLSLSLSLSLSFSLSHTHTHTHIIIIIVTNRSQCATCTCASWDGDDLWLAGVPTNYVGGSHNGLWKKGSHTDTYVCYTHTYSFTWPDSYHKTQKFDSDVIGTNKIMTLCGPDQKGDAFTWSIHAQEHSDLALLITGATSALIPPYLGFWTVRGDHGIPMDMRLTIRPARATGPITCDPSVSGKDKNGWCVCPTASFCGDGAAGDVCDNFSPRDRWKPNKVSVALLFKCFPQPLHNVYCKVLQ
jgi:hypothetical protein